MYVATQRISKLMPHDNMIVTVTQSGSHSLPIILFMSHSNGVKTLISTSFEMYVIR